MSIVEKSRSKEGHACSVYSHRTGFPGQDGPQWAKQDRIGPRLLRLFVSNRIPGPRRAIVGQNEPNRATVGHACSVYWHRTGFLRQDETRTIRVAAWVSLLMRPTMQMDQPALAVSSGLCRSPLLRDLSSKLLPRSETFLALLKTRAGKRGRKGRNCGTRINIGSAGWFGNKQCRGKKIPNRACLWKSHNRLCKFNFSCCMILGTWSMTDG